MRTLLALGLLFGSGCAFMQPVRYSDPPALLHGYNQFTTHPQDVKNLNRDPTGDPWIIGGLILPTDDELNQYPRLSMPTAPRALQLPERVNNTTHKFWRGIFSQKNGSCAQASGIAYVYAYEVNRLRGKNANSPEHKYPTHWTYNFVNRGYDRGSWMMWGWEVGKGLGIPNVKAYGTETGYSLQYWPSDYEVYENAFDNRVDYYWVLDVGSKSGFEYLKRYLHDHGATDSAGGIVSFAAGWSTGYREAKIPEGQYEAGKLLIASFGEVVNHAITFVGYDDRVCYDFNEDGECTNDQDQNGDDKVDMKDWEVGAFIMANSWGTRWGDSGFIYVPYRLLALSPKDGGIYRSYVYGVVPKADSDKGMALRVKMTHSDRSKLRFLSAFETVDDDDQKQYRYYGLQNSGGSYPLNGSSDAPVEFGLDLRNLMKDASPDDVDFVSFLLDSTGGTGTIEKMEVVDYASGKVVESKDADVAIVNGRNTAKANWSGEDDDPDPDPDPEPCSVGPVALAGHDITVNDYCLYEIDGSGSFDRDGEIATYQWRQLYRGNKDKLILENADTAKVRVLVPRLERDRTFWIMLTVTDKDGFFDHDRVRLNVKRR